MQESELPKNMGKKIVDALKQQDFEESTNLNIDNADGLESLDDISLEELSAESKEASFGLLFSFILI